MSKKSFQYNEDHVDNKMRFLETAMELYGMTANNFIPDADHVAGILSVAKRIESYVYSDMGTAETPNLTQDSEAQRKAFLDSISENTCGRGREDCNGSEGTCTCQ